MTHIHQQRLRYDPCFQVPSSGIHGSGRLVGRQICENSDVIASPCWRVLPSIKQLVVTMSSVELYGPICGKLINDAELPALGPGSSNQSVIDVLRSIDVSSIGNGREIRDGQMATCCLSGLWLLHNFLDESHTISQDVQSSTGSFWHGIMHRREPDYGNAKYWYRRVGSHPTYVPLMTAVREQHADFARSVTSDGDWDPFAFVDACQKAASNQTLQAICRDVALLEWQLLFDYCYQLAFAAD